jgi:hypothetical protein
VRRPAGFVAKNATSTIMIIASDVLKPVNAAQSYAAIN